MARSASRSRTVCESCVLPYYAEKEECPYCGASGGTKTATDSEFVFDNEGEPRQTRTTCPECGLTHYEDADECPYCAYAGVPADASGGEAVEPTEPTRTDGPTNDTGLFGRIKQTLGL